MADVLACFSGADSSRIILGFCGMVFVVRDFILLSCQRFKPNATNTRCKQTVVNYRYVDVLDKVHCPKD